MSQMLTGKVKWFNDAKGYGFIEHESGRDVFVHYSVIDIEGYKTLKDGEPVQYEIIEGDKGLHAKMVRRAAASEPSSLSAQVEISKGQPLPGSEDFPQGRDEASEGNRVEN